MKKALLSVCVLAASALAANAQGTVWFSEDFSWAEPYVKEFNLGDPVGTDNAETKGAELKGGSDEKIDGKNVYNQFWDVRGYRMRNWPNANWYDQWIYNCYWGGGSELGQNAGMRFPAIADAPADPDEVYVSFDWCPYKNVEGEYDEVTLHLQTRPGDVNNPNLLTHDLKKGDPMRWIHVEIDFYDADGAVFNNSTNFMIEPIVEQQATGHHRFYLDNFMVHSERVDVGAINEVSVDKKAPVEYYNLQGVRVANPENGLYIRRQGNKSSKVLFK